MSSLSARSLGILLDAWRGEGTRPAYLALAERIRLLILDGRVALGTRLPAEREVATSLGVSRTTVSAAYTHLREGGYLDSIRGSGSVARLPASEGVEGYGSTGSRSAEWESEALDFTKAMLPATPGVASAAAGQHELPGWAPEWVAVAGRAGTDGGGVG